MVSSSKSIPLVTANPDTLSVGDTDALVNKYLNEEAISLNHPEKAASLSSPGGNTTERHRKAQEDEKEPPRKRTETNNESRPRSGEKMTGNGGQAGAQGKDEHTNTNSSGAKPRGSLRFVVNDEAQTNSTSRHPLSLQALRRPTRP